VQPVARVLPSGCPTLTYAEREGLRILIDAATRALELPHGNARQQAAMTRGLRPRYRPGAPPVFWGPRQAQRPRNPTHADYL